MRRLLTFVLLTTTLACGLVGVACSSDGGTTATITQAPPPSPDAAPPACPSDKPAACPSIVPSYSGEIAQVFSGYCNYCHGPNGIAVTVGQFTTYQAVANDKQAILDQLVLCRMPADGGLPLPEAQRADLLAWLVCGAPNN